MKPSKKAQLARAGWTVGDAAEFLQLDPEEARFVDLKLALAAGIRQLREKRGITQTDFARQIGSSQSRVAKMESGDRSVSIDLMVRALLRIGALPSEIAALIGQADSKRAA